MQKSLRELQREVFAEFHGRCCVCLGRADVVHEIEPRSRGDDTINKNNMLTLCNHDHDEVHREGASDEQVERLHRVKSEMEKRLGNNPQSIPA